MKMVQTYKCPGCGAPIEFGAGANELVCQYCGTHVDVNEAEQENEQYKEQYNVENEVEYGDDERTSFNGYNCQSCGANLIVDEHTTATTCCYCGSSALIQQRLEGVLTPAKIIPFKINKNQAKEQFRKWICTGLFTPSVFKKTATLENIKGIYVPFWLYDYQARSSADAKCTKVRRERRGNVEYTHTDHYMVERDVESGYWKIPADASERMPDDVMDCLEPYSYGEMQDFAMPYLSGFESEKYNYESGDHQVADRVEERVKTYIFQDMKSTITGYSSVNFVRNNITLKRKKAMYTLLPVWMITYRYNGENRIFAINGQTGKQVGSLPNSMQKIFAWFGGITVGMTAILLVLGGLLG